MDNLMLNTASQTYLKLPKRGEWQPEHMKILEFMQIFSDIKIINEDNPNFEIILQNPDWDDFEDVLRQIEDTQPSPTPHISCDHCARTASGSEIDLLDAGWVSVRISAPFQRIFIACPDHRKKMLRAISDQLSTRFDAIEAFGGRRIIEEEVI